MASLEEAREVTYHYGLTVVNPAMHVEIVVPPLTFREWLFCIVAEFWYIVSQSLLLAGAVTAFSIALR